MTIIILSSCNNLLKEKNNRILELKLTNRNNKILSIPNTNNSSFSLISYTDNFSDSNLSKLLNQIPNMRIYVQIEFKKKSSYKKLNKIISYGFNIRNKIFTEYLDKKKTIFYGKYKFLRKISTLKFIKKINILDKYQSEGYYKINFKTEHPINNINYYIYLPNSKNGKKLITKKIYLSGNFNLLRKSITNNLLKVNINSYGKPIKIFSFIKYNVDLTKSLKNHIYICGNISISNYILQMKKNYSNIYKIYTKQSKKIIFNSNVTNIVKQINNYIKINKKYKIITQILNNQINYDYKKKKLFFTGHLVYNNISDMYLNTTSLSQKKIGACPDRSSLEAAILRLSKIATRISTRAGHIYVEIFIPKKGWVTTSLTLNEVPLCVSTNENQSYFIFWKPNFPGRILKWESILYPKALFEESL